jgi:hypothetical protein
VTPPNGRPAAKQLLLAPRFHPPPSHPHPHIRNPPGVAAVLAVLDLPPGVPCPPVEALFTVEEEIGLLGAAALDASLLTGRTLLNLDSEDWGVVYIGCEGWWCSRGIGTRPPAGLTRAAPRDAPSAGGRRGGDARAAVAGSPLRTAPTRG